MSGVDTARNMKEIAERLRRCEYTIIDIREERSPLKNILQKFGFAQRLPLYPTVVFFRQLSTLVKAGITLNVALETLSRQEVDQRVDRAVHDLQKGIREGKSLAQAFESRGELFPPLVVPLVKAGEISGTLDEMLERLTLHLERELSLLRSWRQAAAYPILIFVVCAILTLGLVTYVFPTFIGMFKGLSVELPLATRALITITETVRNPVVVMPVLLAGVVGLYLCWLHFKTPVGRRQWDWIKLEMPYLGPISKKIAFSRIARTFGVLLSSGVTILVAIKVAGQAAGNSVVKDALERIAFEMKEGAKFSDRLACSELFPTVFVQLVQAGEESGELPVQLERLGDIFEEDVLLSMAVFTSLIEPVMITVMGAIVMFVLVAVFQPVYQLMTLF